MCENQKDYEDEMFSENNFLYSHCPTCGISWEDHPKDKDGKPGECDGELIIERIRPRFYMMDLKNYTDDFLREIIEWQNQKIELLEKLRKKLVSGCGSLKKDGKTGQA